MSKYKIRFGIAVFILLIANTSYSDIIYLRNGSQVVGEPKIAGAGGYWINGVLFSGDEVERIVSMGENDSLNLNISGVIEGDGMAIINNEVVSIGDKIGGATVKEIGKNFVKFELNGEPIIKEVSSGVSQANKSAGLQAYYQRQRANERAVNSMRRENEVEKWRREENQREVLERAKVSSRYAKVKQALKNKEISERSERGIGGERIRDISEPCQWDGNQFVGACFPTEKEIKVQERREMKKLMGEIESKEKLNKAPSEEDIIMNSDAFGYILE